MASQEDLCHIMQSTNTYYKQTVFKNKVPEEQQNGYEYLHCLWESARRQQLGRRPAGASDTHLGLCINMFSLQFPLSAPAHSLGVFVVLILVLFTFP